jgi:coenzyme F420-reducing hydrogenase alpha subunit
LTANVLTIKPVTRIEGAMQITIGLDEAGNVEFTHANVQEFRGFERFLCGRHVSKLPTITPRICGVCPVPHHLASLKAIEAGLGIEPPQTAQLLRELMLACEHVSDHMLHMFVLAGPDILLPDLEPEDRGLPSLYAQCPDVVREVFRIRNVTQSLISALGVQAVHPETGVPGGMTTSLSESQRKRYLTGVRLAKDAILKFHDAVWLPQVKKAAERYADLGALDTHFLALSRDDHICLYDGVIRVVGPGSEIVHEVEPAGYLTCIGEKTVDYSYGKLAYLKSSSDGGDILRTGPVGRVNVAESAGTQHANAYMEEFRTLFGEVAQQTLALDFARYVCTVYAIERAEQLLEDERLSSMDVYTPVEYASGEGVGAVEAPRGLLIHHFRWDDAGYVTMANIITPTNMNCYAIDSSLTQAAERSIGAGQVRERQLKDEIGLLIRAYDPCLSCATHALSDPPSLLIEIIDSQGHRSIV